jgi:hypothetical protein
MREPVMLEDGRSYEKANIERWFHQQQLEEKPASSPVTRAVLRIKTFKTPSTPGTSRV